MADNDRGGETLRLKYRGRPLRSLADLRSAPVYLTLVAGELCLICGRKLKQDRLVEKQLIMPVISGKEEAYRTNWPVV